MRWFDRVTAALILLVGAAHLAASAPVFSAPSERGVWFLSAGLFGLTAGLANLARAQAGAPSRLLSAASLSGSLGLLLMGGLLFAAGGDLGPQAAVVLVVGAVAALFGAVDLLRRRSR